jgi:hypothetical protein
MHITRQQTATPALATAANATISAGKQTNHKHYVRWNKATKKSENDQSFPPLMLAFLRIVNQMVNCAVNLLAFFS